MDRSMIVAAAQMGPVGREETRAAAVARLLAMMREAKARGAGLVVFPELALTTFFPRWVLEGEALDRWYERAMPSAETRVLFEEAARLSIGFCLGYAEAVEEEGRLRRFNTAILVDRSGAIVGKYRKVHLPGHATPQEGRAFQHLEKRYFEPGNLGFPVWRTMGALMGMCICNDRRWPETWRVMGLQGVELVLLGYNTPFGHALYPDVDALTGFHNRLSLQAGAYQNATWAVGTAKCGNEEGSMMLGESMIVAPSGEVVAQAVTLGDEVIAARIDLDMGIRYRKTFFDFARHRRPEAYGLIVERTGAVPPPE